MIKKYLLLIFSLFLVLSFCLFVKSDNAEVDVIKITIYYTNGTSTCTYSGSGDWNIHIQDNCTLNTDTNLPSNNIIFSGGGGSIIINSTIQARNILFAPTLLNKLSMIWINKGARMFVHK
jgi:hypothetical protein